MFKGVRSSSIRGVKVLWRVKSVYQKMGSFINYNNTEAKLVSKRAK